MGESDLDQDDEPAEIVRRTLVTTSPESQDGDSSKTDRPSKRPPTAKPIKKRQLDAEATGRSPGEVIQVGFVDTSSEAISAVVERAPPNARIVLVSVNAIDERVENQFEEEAENLEWHTLENPADYAAVHTEIYAILTDLLEAAERPRITISLPAHAAIVTAAITGVVDRLVLETPEYREALNLYGPPVELRDGAPSGETRSRIPLLPDPDIGEYEAQVRIVELLADVGSVESVSELARLLADTHEIEYTESYRSSVQHNARSLEQKGYVKREDNGRSYRVSLTDGGRIWAGERTSADRSK